MSSVCFFCCFYELVKVAWVCFLGKGGCTNKWCVVVYELLTWQILYCYMFNFQGGNRSAIRSLNRGGYASCDTLQLCATSADIHIGFRSVCIELINGKYNEARVDIYAHGLMCCISSAVMYVDISNNKTIKEMLAIVSKLQVFTSFSVG